MLKTKTTSNQTLFSQSLDLNHLRSETKIDCTSNAVGAECRVVGAPQGQGSAAGMKKKAKMASNCWNLARASCTPWNLKIDQKSLKTTTSQKDAQRAETFKTVNNKWHVEDTGIVQIVLNVCICVNLSRIYTQYGLRKRAPLYGSI